MTRGVSFVIPWQSNGDPARERSFYWNLVRLQRLFGGSDINFGGKSSRTTWSRGRDINFSATTAMFDVLAIVDSDTVFNAETLRQGMVALEGGASWVIPYETYFRVGKDSTDRILAANPDESIFREDHRYDLVMTAPPDGPYESPQSGLLLVRKSDFERVGGFCPSFEGWGYEDRAFVHVMDTLVGPHVRTGGEVFHLWHNEPVQETWRQPHLVDNKMLYDRMLSADPDELLAINKGVL